MKRLQAIQNLLDQISKESFGTTIDAVQEQKICISCKVSVKPEDFGDQISKNEYAISGLCQKCQDEIFNFIEASGIEVEVIRPGGEVS